MSDHNDRIIARIKGVPAQAGTPESDADPANPNRKSEEAMTHPQAETKRSANKELVDRIWHETNVGPAKIKAILDELEDAKDLWQRPSPATPHPGDVEALTQIGRSGSSRKIIVEI